ncbi:DUF5703 family protein [Kineococcus aurantiacus]|uniref:Uncharacterized protein n=1 Tax=Kineococcus aurantiacus TaxID=37633 RepID=A0A7Y9DIN9_9ACTN|nr:DUF5703 family protein [Kineococcus aurantiacus]NYD20669.1 hypothetical protein [Kineococcus aurantiacus]
MADETGGGTGRNAGAGAADQYEYRVLTLSRETTRSDARQLLTEHAEYGRWELARVRLYMGGSRKVWLRRKIIRVARTA